MARKKKPVNNTPYPDYVIETVARCLWPDIQAFFESEEGQRDFAEWKAEQEKKKQMESTEQLAAKKRDVTDTVASHFGVIHTGAFSPRQSAPG